MHPVFYLVAEFAITVLVVGFVPPKSFLRAVGLVPITFCVAQCIPICMLYMTRTPWAALVGGYSVTYLYHYLDVAVLSRWSFKQRTPTSGLVKPTTGPTGTQAFSTPTDQDSISLRLAFGLKVASSFRFIGTSYQVKNIPPVIATERTYYIQRTFAIIGLSYIVLDFINSSNDVEIASKYLNIDKIPLLSRLNEVTVEELLIRGFTVLAAGISLNCVQGGIYYTLAVLAVSTGVSSPSEWPPFYGSPREAYTLRRFWNIFWHQTNARKFTTISHYLVHDLFEIRRGTTIARCLRILAAFMSSGIMHMLVDLASGINLSSSGAMNFFIAQALGLIIEDAVIHAYRRLPRETRLSKVAENGIGFSWVSLFLAWSVPAYVYPMMWRSNQGLNDSTIPFTLFGSNAERINAVSCFLTLGLVSLLGVFIKPRSRN